MSSRDWRASILGRLTENARPLEFVDELGSVPRHIVLLYEKPPLGRLIEYRFIENGLRKGQPCVYATYGDPTAVMRQLEAFGIDVSRHSLRKMLRVVRITNPNNDPKGPVHGFRRIIKEICPTEPSTLSRIVSHCVPDLQSPEHIRSSIEIEPMVQEIYLDGERKTPLAAVSKTISKFIFMCNFEVPKVRSRIFADFVRCELSSHHAAIFMAERLKDGKASNLPKRKT